MDEEGKIRNIVSKEYPLFFPHPGWSEQRPQDWFEQSMEGIRELTAECDKEEVAGISFGGQMHGLVALDRMIMLSARRYCGMTDEQGKRRIT